MSIKHCPQHGDWDDDKWKMCPVCAMQIAADFYRAQTLREAFRPRRQRQKASLLDRIFPTDLNHF